MTGARISALFRQGLYRARKKRLIDISSLAGCHHTFNEVTPGTIPRSCKTQGIGVDVYYQQKQ